MSVPLERELEPALEPDLTVELDCPVGPDLTVEPDLPVEPDLTVEPELDRGAALGRELGAEARGVERGADWTLCGAEPFDSPF